MSIMGLYNYNPKVFDTLVIPDGVDRDTVIETIISNCAEFEILYPSWPVMQVMIGVWSRKELDVWTKLFETTQFEYNPIYNYDRTEEWTDSTDDKTRKDSTGTDTEKTVDTKDLKNDTENNTDVTTTGGEHSTRTDKLTEETDTTRTLNQTGQTETNSSVANTGEDKTIHNVAPFNSETVQEAYDDTTKLGSNTNTKSTVKPNLTDTETTKETKKNTGTVENDSDITSLETTEGRTIEKMTGTDTITRDGKNAVREDVERSIENLRKGRAYGNIGVMSTQQMIEMQREVVKFNIYDYICESFQRRFCLLIY